MPLYDYKCGKCGKVFEVRQSFSDPLLTTHEDCGGPLERLISTPALQFKGSGWYITDYARAGNANTAGKSESKSDSKSESKNDTKGGSKSETKSDSKSDTSSSSSSSSGSKKSE